MVFEFLHPVLRQYMMLWFFRCDKGVLWGWFCDNHKGRWNVMGCVEASGICYYYGVLFHKAASLLWCTGTGFRHCNTWGMCLNHIRILISTLSFILLKYIIVLSSWNCLYFLRLGFLMVSSNPAVFVSLLMGKRTPIEYIFFIVPAFMRVPNFEYCFTKGFSWWGIWWTGWWWDSSNDQGTAGDTDSTCCPRWWWWYWIQELWCVSV